MEPGGECYPAIMDLPNSVVRKLAGILDGAAVYNWRTLVECLPEYTHSDAMLFRTAEQQGRSPTLAILQELNSRGWSVVDLAQLAHKAQLGIIVDTIKDHCRDCGWSLPLPPPCVLHSAKICQQRPSCPPYPTPPTSPTAINEALVRYNSASTPEGSGALLAAAVNIPYNLLHTATAGFAPVAHSRGGHKLGEGGSGEVFYCQVPLKTGQEKEEVAVKVLRRVKDKSNVEVLSQRQFMAEIQALSMLSHPHLMPVLGFSCDGPQQCILYPYFVRGSLDHHLPHTHSLTASRRVKVACEVASAIEYLHTGCEKVFIHRDIKSANILVAENWSVALGDYGVLRVQPSAGTMITTTVAGTQEYMDYDYVTSGVVSEKTDIYSFGVVLFELLLGATACGPICGHDTDIVTFVEEFEDAVSSVLIGQWPEDVGERMWSVAEQCVEANRKRRLASGQVHSRLLALIRDTH